MKAHKNKFPEILAIKRLALSKPIKYSRITSDYFKNYVIPSVAHCARFYAVPKVHKRLEIPFRPLVSGMNQIFGFTFFSSSE